MKDDQSQSESLGGRPWTSLFNMSFGFSFFATPNLPGEKRAKKP